MNKQIDIKSLVIGILLTVCVILAMGARQSSVSTLFGRFQLAATENNAYIIDSTTGQVWRRSHAEFYPAKVRQDSIVEKKVQ